MPAVSRRPSCRVLPGDCLNLLPGFPEDYFDSIVTDPPYGLEFMGKEWDKFKPSGARIRCPSGKDASSGRTHNATTSLVSRNAPEAYIAGPTYQEWCETWASECLRVLKPGGYLLAFGGTRTWHWLACAIELSGFEIRDSIDWIYGSGFPKSKTSLKPAHEPIILARKPARRSEPLPGLDACRVAHASDADRAESEGKNRHADFGSIARDNHVYGSDERTRASQGNYDGSTGRWPPNILLSDEAADELDAQSGITRSTGGKGTISQRTALGGAVYGEYSHAKLGQNAGGLGDTGGASRFFPVFRYQAKAPKSERPRLEDGTAWPTVKPLELLRWLVRLVTEPGGRVLDPFAGTGTTGQACLAEGFGSVLIERDPVALELIRVRIPEHQ